MTSSGFSCLYRKMSNVGPAPLQVFGIVAIAVLCLAVAGAERRLLQGKVLSMCLIGGMAVPLHVY